MNEICKGVQFGIRKTIVDHKNMISYQRTRFLGVTVRISDSFSCEKAKIYDFISLKVEQIFNENFVFSIILCEQITVPNLESIRLS